jgi:hypothetical protein
MKETSMKKTILLSAALLLGTALAIAQDTPQSGSSSQTPATSSSDQASASTSSNTIEGCLTGASGNYMLTDATGVMYQLTGDESAFSPNVNKEVEVTGTASARGSAAESHTPDSNAGEASGTSGSANNSAGEASASTSANAKMLEVTTIRKIADNCSSTIGK